jgi:predicted metallopeptidase
VLKEKQKKLTFAEIMPIRFPATLYTDKVFVIVVYPVFTTIAEKDKELIMYHELLHIQPDDPSKLRDHDIEDFRDMIEQFGLDWEPTVEI